MTKKVSQNKFAYKCQTAAKLNAVQQRYVNTKF